MQETGIQEDTIKKFQDIGVEILYLFGSRASQTETLSSDIDFGIVFSDTSLLENTLDIYNNLYRALSEDPFIPDDIEIDLVFLQKASIALQFDVINRGRLLYERSPRFRADYEEYVTREYIEMKPKLDEYQYVTLETFS